MTNKGSQTMNVRISELQTMIMMNTTQVPQKFHQLRRQYMSYCQRNPVPPALHYKLMFISDCITGECHDFGSSDVKRQQFEQLRTLGLQQQIKLFFTLSRCVMGLGPSDGLRDKQAYIKKDKLLSKWEKCLVSANQKELIITQKDVLTIPLSEIRISARVNAGSKKYSFLIEIHKKLFKMGCDTQKAAVHIHSVIKQLVLDRAESRKGAEDPIMSSAIMERKLTEQQFDTSNQQIQRNPDDEQIESLQSEADYKLLEYINQGRILKHQYQKNIFKCFCLIKAPKTNISPAEIAINLYTNSRQWNPQVQQSQILAKPDADTYIVYEQIRKSSMISWARDYVLLRKAKKITSDKFILKQTSVEYQDKPAQYLTYRSNISKESLFSSKIIKQQNVIILITKFKVEGGEEDANVALRYLRAYDKFQSYCAQKMLLQFKDKYFSFEHVPIRKPVLQTFLSMQDYVNKQPAQTQFIELCPSSIESQLTQSFASNVRCLQHWNHPINHKHRFQVRDYKGRLITQQNDFIFQHGDWRMNAEQELIFSNQQAIDAQKDTIKYILKSIGTNLLKGNSIMNMSLPVDIFDNRSILERTAASYGYAPIFLGKAANEKSIIEQIKLTCSFMLSVPLLQLKIQKPFNPVLGETFQGYLGGIPIYFQQVSHHPPISAYYMKTKDFLMYGTEATRAQMKFNAVVGMNNGYMTIKYDLTNTVLHCYMPVVQVSGLIYGQRKLKIAKKLYVICQSQQILCEVSFQNQKQGVYTWSGKQGPLVSSSILGGIYKVTRGFMNRFKAEQRKYRFDGVQRAEILQKLSNIEGYWNGDVTFDGKIFRSRYDPLPYQLEYEMFPLASNSTYRQDIIYKRMKKLDVSQVKKQEIQNIQRRDRKLRSEHSRSH